MAFKIYSEDGRAVIDSDTSNGFALDFRGSSRPQDPTGTHVIPSASIGFSFFAYNYSDVWVRPATTFGDWASPFEDSQAGLFQYMVASKSAPERGHLNLYDHNGVLQWSDKSAMRSPRVRMVARLVGGQMSVTPGFTPWIPINSIPYRNEQVQWSQSPVPGAMMGVRSGFRMIWNGTTLSIRFDVWKGTGYWQVDRVMNHGEAFPGGTPIPLATFHEYQ